MKNAICLVTPKAPPIGGIATWYSVLEKRLMQVVDVYHVNSSISSKEFNASSVFSRFLQKIKRFLRIKKEVKKVLNDKDVGILHICTSGGFGFVRDFCLIKIAKKHGVKTCVHFHFGRIPSILSNHSRETKWLLNVLKYGDSFVCLDSETKEAIHNAGFDAVIINNPVDIHEKTDCQTSRQIVFVGTLNKNKGIYELLHSFNELNRKKQKFDLAIVGPIDKNEYKEVNETLKRNKCHNLIYYGELSHPKTLEIIKMSRFLVLPSKTEGMPYSVLEAMSFGIPIVSTNVGYIKRMVDGCGVVLEKRFSSYDLTDALSLLLNNDELVGTYSKKAYQRIKEEYSTDSVIKQLLNVWFN